MLLYQTTIVICNVYLTIQAIFTAEAKAIDPALDFFSTCNANNKFCIESNEPYQFKESTDSETLRKMS